MYLTNHVSTVLLVSQIPMNPFLAFGIGLLSHYLLDMVPQELTNGSPKEGTHIQQIRGLRDQGRQVVKKYQERITKIKSDRTAAEKTIADKIESLKEQIMTLGADTETPKTERQWKMKQLFLELDAALTGQQIAIAEKDEIQQVVEDARESVELEAEKQPIIKGVHVLLKYAESQDLRSERNPELVEWKEKNLMDIQRVKQLYGGQFPGELPAHLGWLLMTMDTRLEDARSKAGNPTEFQFAIKKYSTLVMHFEELIDGIWDRVNLDLPGGLDKIAHLISEKSRLQKAAAKSNEARKKEVATRVEGINKQIEELRVQVKEYVKKHMAQLPPPDVEMMPHTKEQWGTYATEAQARGAIEALLSVPLSDTVWLEELGEVKALVEFYRVQEKDVEETLRLRIQNKIRYFQLKFDLIRENLVKDDVLNPEGGTPSMAEEAVIASTPTAQLTSNEQPMQMDETPEETQEIPTEVGEVVYAHRPSGERFIFDEKDGWLILPTPPQMLLMRERLRERLSTEELKSPDRVEQAVEELIKRKDEEVAFMSELLRHGSFELVQEILNMPYTDFQNEEWFTKAITEYIKQEGLRAKKKHAKKARKFIMEYLDKTGYVTKNGSLQIGEVMRRAIDYKNSTPETGPDA